jgi:hypothetical protein
MESPVKTILTGVLVKRNEGYDYVYTRISINGLNGNKNIEVNDQRIFGLFKRKYKEQERQKYLELIRKYQAKKILIDNDILEIEFDYIFNSNEDFEKIEIINDELINKASR